MITQKLPSKETLLSLRHESKMSLQEIADLYGASRERVRQIIGNTGRKMLFESSKSVVIPESMTKTEALSLVEKWRGKGNILKRLWKMHHKIKNSIGNDAEFIVSKELSDRGFSNKCMPLIHPFDILLSNGIRIDVKASESNFKASPRQKGNMYHFGVKKDKKGNYCDFFIFYIVITGDFFVVPNDVIGMVHSLYIGWPKSERSWSEWHQYHNRFDLLGRP